MFVVIVFEDSIINIVIGCLWFDVLVWYCSSWFFLSGVVDFFVIVIVCLIVDLFLVFNVGYGDR